MHFPDPQPGMVIQYSYLWVREHLQGLEEGRKDRPAVVVLATEREDGNFIVTVAPITTQRPTDPRTALQLSPQAMKHLGLDYRASYVVIKEVNRFHWPGPDLRPVSSDRFHYGSLSAKMFNRVKARIEEFAHECRLSFVVRTE